MNPEELFSDIIVKSSKDSQIKNIVAGVVKEVNGNNCDVQIEGGPLLYDVRLQAIENAVSSFIRITPKLDSVVLVGVIENMEAEAAVMQCSEIDEVEIMIGAKTYKINSEGHLIKGGADTLLDALKLLIEAVQVIVVLQGHNPDYIKLQQALVKINNILS